MRARAIRAIAVASALSFVLAACGQKPGVHVEGGQLAGQGGGGSLDANPGGTEDGGFAAGETGFDDTGTATGDSGAGAGGDGSFGGSGGGGSTSTSTGSGGSPSGDTGGSSGGGSGSSGGGGGGGQQGTQTPQGSDRTGAGPNELVFGLHAPVTGAAPLPAPSFEKSGDLYWRWLTDSNRGKGEPVLGREKVSLIFEDDKYKPDAARQVCRELADKSFALAGGGGTDQIQACGQLAAREQFPYFSAGVTEAGLKDNAWYFASSMTYRQQGMLLANMVAKNPYNDDKIAKVLAGKGKLAAIFTNTPNFQDARQGWEQGLDQFGLRKHYYTTYMHPKGDDSWYSTVAEDFRAAGVEVVYILSAPVDYIDFSFRAHDSYKYNPRYIGVGVSMGLNVVLASGCGNPDTRADKGIFFSPFPGIDWARNNAAGKEFFKAADAFNVPNDDIAFGLWGANAVTHELLLRYQQIYGNDLTREDFRAVVEQQTGVSTGVFPDLNYSPQNHFGAQQVHVLQANCATGEYETLDDFTSGF